jgi:hypothetical protein
MPLSPEDRKLLQDEYESLKKQLADMEKAEPGASVESARPTDMLDGVGARMKASFADDAGLNQMLESRGFTDIGRDKEGRVIAKNIKGEWVTDADKFFNDEPGLKGYLPGHPVNWAASRVGHALPTAGFMIGGGAGAVEGAGIASFPAATAGAAAGASVGELARKGVGSLLGVQKGQGAASHILDVGQAGIEGGAAELGGRTLGKVGWNGYNVDAGTKYLLKQLKEKLVNPASAALVKGLTGVPMAASLRLLERRPQVLKADDPGAVRNLGVQAAEELDALNRDKNTAISQARDKFALEFGDAPVDTTPIIAENQRFATRKAPNDADIGPVTAPELRTLNRLERRAFTTPKMGEAPVPGAYSSRPVFNPEPRTMQPEVKAQVFEPTFEKDGSLVDISTPVAPKIVKNGPVEPVATLVEPRIVADGNQVPVSQPVTPKLTYGKPQNQKVVPSQGYSPIDVPVSTVDLGLEPVGAMTKMQPVRTEFQKTGVVRQQPVRTEIAQTGPVSRMQPMKPGLRDAGEQVVQPEVQVSDLMGFENRMPEQTAGSLQKTADYLDRKIKAYFDRNRSSGRGDAYLSHLEQLRGKIKDLLHRIDPQGLGAADAGHSTYKQEVKLLSPLERDGSVESFVDGLFGKNKTATREAVGKLLPKSAEGINDLALSARSMNPRSSRAARSAPGKRFGT